MSFFDEISLPETNNNSPIEKSSGDSSFFSSITLPNDPEKAARIAEGDREMAKEVKENIGFKATIKNMAIAAKDLVKRGAKALIPDNLYTKDEIKEAIKIPNLATGAYKTFEGVKSFVGNTVNPMGYQVSPTGKIITTGAKPSKIIDTISGSFIDERDRIVELIKSINTEDSTPLENVVNIGKVGVGGLNIAFSPITGAISEAEDNPVTGPLAKGVNYLFGKLGELGGWEAEIVVNNLPISDKSKETILPLASELAGLLNQTAAGKLGEVGFSKIKSLRGEIKDNIVKGYEEAKKVSVKSETPEKIDVRTNGKTSTERFNSRVDEQNKKIYEDRPNPENKYGQYEPYAPEGVIDFGKSAKRDTSGKLRYEPIPQEILTQQIIAKAKSGMSERPTAVEVPKVLEAAERVQKNATVEPVRDFVEAPKEEFKAPKEVSLTAEEKATSKLSADIAKKMKEELGDLPEYNVMNMDEQVRLTKELQVKDPQYVRDIAMGDRLPPEGIREGSVFTYLREEARLKGDVQTLIDLSKSKLATEASILGQRIKAYDAFRDPADPVKAIQDIREAREKNIKGDVVKQKEAIKKDIKEEIAKKAPTKQTWEDFIKEIKCNY